MHGNGFQLVDAGPKKYLANGNPLYKNSQSNPPVKDTFAVPPAGYACVRFISDNPGYWYAHCHIEPHMHIGMRFTLKIGEDEDMVEPPDEFPVCGEYLPSFCPDNSKPAYTSKWH